MIFANINPAEHKITLISVPRDLYYNGRKINSIYYFYGMEELKRSLSIVTGYEIDKYILIDMYAFIDVIDIIGGVDVHLDQPVIDPTYKTFDGGKWGTLYYRAGDHHLSGKQALRLARSRHTSSDFARSERQHLILAAVKDKAKTLGIGDAGKLKELAESVLSRTETDIEIQDALTYFFRYQNFEVEGGHVMSSGNVLVSQYTNDVNGQAPKTCTTNEEGEETCKAGDRGAYILVPQNGSWNTTRWFFHQILEGDE
ncbi:LCP family protein [Candidatus Peregrinibacteria bacterium]|nr:LCP family protein [Candidatus Peregrinibacteria bacterium]